MSFYLFIVISFYLNIARKNIVCDVGLIRLKKTNTSKYYFEKMRTGVNVRFKRLSWSDKQHNEGKKQRKSNKRRKQRNKSVKNSEKCYL